MRWQQHVGAARPPDGVMNRIPAFSAPQARVGLAALAFVILASAALAGASSTLTKFTIDNLVTLELPPDARGKPGQGIDSIIGSIKGKGFTCEYDLGVYSNHLTGIEGSSEQVLTISGRPARLVEAPPDFDGLHIADIEKTLLGPRLFTISCKSGDKDARDAVRTMLRSARLLSKG